MNREDSHLSRRSILAGVGGFIAVAPSAVCGSQANSKISDQLNVQSPATHPRHYHADGMYQWDSWYLPVGAEVHMFHLQVKRNRTDRWDEDSFIIGHAVSRDLVSWTQLPVALRRGPTGSYDEGELYTGCAVSYDNTIYLFYCGNKKDFSEQTLCLATSKDGIHFTKHPDNPIIRPDKERFGLKDCRDILVLKDPQGPGWLGYVVMRLKNRPDYEACCIMLCRSTDLVHWTVGEPIFQTRGYNTFEVVDVFKLGDKWRMLNLSGGRYGQRAGWLSDPNIRLLTFVAEVDAAAGPFREVRDNLVLASTDKPWQGFSARTLDWKGERLMLFTRSEGATPWLGRLSWPVKLAPRPEGGLDPVYWSGLEPVFGKSVVVSAREVTTAAAVPIPEVQDRVEVYQVNATLHLNTATAAGLEFGSAAERRGYTALLDTAGGPQGQVSLLSAADGVALQHRHWPIRGGGAYRLRLLVVHGMVDIYVNDVLVLNFFLPGLKPGALALVARGGQVSFSGIDYRVPRQ